MVWCELEPELLAQTRKALRSHPLAHRLVEWDPAFPLLPPELDYSGTRRVATVALTGGRSLHPDEYDRMQSLLFSQLENFWKNKITLSVMGPLWSRNLWRNLASFDKLPSLTADVLKRNWQDKTIVVAGAGPGLEELLPSLRRHRGSLAIIAVDTALGVLSDNGIRPELVAALEGQIHNLADFIGNSDTEIPLALDLSSHPATSRATGGPVLWTMTRWTDLSVWDRLRSAGCPALDLPPRGSVGNYAAELALLLSDGIVYHAGLDFSFPAGKTHARGSPHHRRLLARQDRLHPAAGQAYIYNAQTHDKTGWRTTPALRGYAAQLEQQAKGRLETWTENSIPIIKLDSTGKVGNSTSTRWDATVFLKREKEIVNQVLEGIALANKGAFPGNWQERMQAADHLWAWFPDPGLPNRESSFLSRVLAEASGWITRNW